MSAMILELLAGKGYKPHLQPTESVKVRPKSSAAVLVSGNLAKTTFRQGGGSVAGQPACQTGGSAGPQAAVRLNDHWTWV